MRCVSIEVADSLADGRALWLRWNRALGSTDDGYLTPPAADQVKDENIGPVIGVAGHQVGGNALVGDEATIGGN
jgi:hypothetical protein